MHCLKDFGMKTLLSLLACFIFFISPAKAFDQGEKLEDDMIFLYRESVEMYWNDWTAKELSTSKIYISGEGKTATFDGIIQLNCESSSGYSWITASTGYDKMVAKEAELNYTVPIQVVSAAFDEFCPKDK